MSKLEQITVALVSRNPKLELVRAAVLGRTVIVMAVANQHYEVWNWSATVAGGLYRGEVGLSYYAADVIYQSRKQAKNLGQLSSAV